MRENYLGIGFESKSFVNDTYRNKKHLGAKL